MQASHIEEASLIVETIKRALGTTFSFVELMRYVSHQIGLPLEYREVALPEGVTSCTLPWSDRQLICVSEHANPEQKRYARCYELGHLLVAHVQKAHGSMATSHDLLARAIAQLLTQCVAVEPPFA